MRSSSLESTVAKACKTVPELHIPEDAQVDAKIRKLAAGVQEARAESGRVNFEFNMKIAELELKLQPMNFPEVWEQCRITIKEGITTLDTTVTDCVTLFD